MRTLVQTLKRNVYGLAAVILLLSMVLPVALARSVAAEQITERSIDMSTSSPGATAVEYTVTFTPGQTAEIQGIIVDFCLNSAVIGASCTDASMTVGTTVESFEYGSGPPTDDTSEWTGALATEPTDAVVLTRADEGVEIEASEPVTIVLSGFTNPSATGTFYARILTYEVAADAEDYESGDPAAGDVPLDTGGVALSTVDDIDVTAVVSESLTFCVSGSPISAGCADPVPASLTLGEGTGDALALTTEDISEAIAYFQLSTNAAGRTAVKLRNGAASGGLNSGSNFIPPIDHATAPQTLATGNAGFGVRVPTTTAGDPGSVAVAGASPYASGSAGALNMRTPEATSPYGDEIANTGAGGPVSNANVPLTFGAQASNLTAAGIYTAAIVLIATSTY